MLPVLCVPKTDLAMLAGNYAPTTLDLGNAGAEWVDEQVGRAGNLVTSRKLDEFNKAMIELFVESSATRRVA